MKNFISDKPVYKVDFPRLSKPLSLDQVYRSQTTEMRRHS